MTDQVHSNPSLTALQNYTNYPGKFQLRISKWSGSIVTVSEQNASCCQLGVLTPIANAVSNLFNKIYDKIFYHDKTDAINILKEIHKSIKKENSKYYTNLSAAADKVFAQIQGKDKKKNSQDLQETHETLFNKSAALLEIKDHAVLKQITGLIEKANQISGPNNPFSKEAEIALIKCAKDPKFLKAFESLLQSAEEAKKGFINKIKKGSVSQEAEKSEQDMAEKYAELLPKLHRHLQGNEEKILKNAIGDVLSVCMLDNTQANTDLLIPMQLIEKNPNILSPSGPDCRHYRRIMKNQETLKNLKNPSAENRKNSHFHPLSRSTLRFYSRWENVQLTDHSFKGDRVITYKLRSGAEKTLTVPLDLTELKIKNRSALEQVFLLIQQQDHSYRSDVNILTSFRELQNKGVTQKDLLNLRKNCQNDKNEFKTDAEAKILEFAEKHKLDRSHIATLKKCLQNKKEKDLTNKWNLSNTLKGVDLEKLTKIKTDFLAKCELEMARTLAHIGNKVTPS